MKNLWKALFSVLFLIAIGASAHAGYRHSAQAHFALSKVDEYASDSRLKYQIYCERRDFFGPGKDDFTTTFANFSEIEDPFYDIFNDNIRGGELSSDYVNFESYYRENFKDTATDFVLLRGFKPEWIIESARIEFHHGTNQIKKFFYKTGTYKKVAIGSLSDPRYRTEMKFNKIYICSIVE